MLTEIQLKNLEPLTKHPKYGKLLCDAIEVWKTENVYPITRRFGIAKNVFTNTYCQESNEGSNQYCCLIGAAITGKEVALKFPLVIAGIREVVLKNFQISYEEMINLFQGFDCVNNFGLTNESYEFGKAVHLIVFKE